MERRFFGFFLIDINVSVEKAEQIEQKMDELYKQANEEFASWLGANGLKQAFGMIMNKENSKIQGGTSNEGN